MKNSAQGEPFGSSFLCEPYAIAIGTDYTIWSVCECDTLVLVTQGLISTGIMVTVFI